MSTHKQCDAFTDQLELLGAASECSFTEERVRDLRSEAIHFLGEPNLVALTLLCASVWLSSEMIFPCLLPCNTQFGRDDQRTDAAE